MKVQLLLTSFLLATGAAQPSDPKAVPNIDAKAAFARLKSLAGEWESATSMGKSKLTYSVIAAGSALVEHDEMGDMKMETVYHLDGPRLLLTHYCAAGNQPRMQAESFKPDTGEIGFRFLDVTNLAGPKAGHMRNVSFRLLDDSHFEAEWEFWEGGKPKNTETFKYTRVR